MQCPTRGSAASERVAALAHLLREAIEEIGNVLGLDADALVPHRDGRLAVLRERAHDDLPLLRGVLDGVGEDVGDRLAEAIGIGADGERIPAQLSPALIGLA